MHMIYLAVLIICKLQYYLFIYLFITSKQQNREHKSTHTLQYSTEKESNKINALPTYNND